MWEKINALLERNDLTMKEFANAIGCSQGNVSDWKAGKSKPGWDVMVKIAKYFQTSLDWFVE